MNIPDKFGLVEDTKLVANQNEKSMKDKILSILQKEIHYINSKSEIIGFEKAAEEILKLK